MQYRRGFLRTAAALGLVPLTARLPLATAAGTADGPTLETIRGDWRALAPAGLALPSATDPEPRGEAQWREALSPQAFEVLFEEDTERPFSSPLNAEKRPGLYLCAACDLPLFSSQMKYDSGTGWPSFFTAIPEHLGTSTDFRLIWPRTEYHCVRCGGHQGHVFDDGPAPTGQRWCNNGLALRFVAADPS